MILDAKGLREGERLLACSDDARLWWPYLAAAADSAGRMPLSYGAVLAYRFRNPPSESAWRSWIEEYRANYLLFVYLAGNSDAWGQWYLLHNKRRATSEAPAPPTEAYEAWIAEYAASKRERSTTAFGHLPCATSGQDGEFPGFASALRSSWPATDDAMIRRIVMAAVAAVPDVTEAELLQAAKIGRRPGQYSAGLYLTTLAPAVRAVRATMDAYITNLEHVEIQETMTQDELDRLDRARLSG